MGKRKRRKKIKKILGRLRERIIAATGSSKAMFDEVAARYREAAAQGQIPERCPCGKRWKNCHHRDDLLGTHH